MYELSELKIYILASHMWCTMCPVSICLSVYSKTCVKRPIKNRQNKYIANGSLKKVESIAECGRFTQVLLFYYQVNTFSMILIRIIDVRKISAIINRKIK